MSRSCENRKTLFSQLIFNKPRHVTYQIEMTHNAKFSQKSWLDWLKWPILVILQVFPHNEAQIHLEWPFSCNSQLFPSFATKASHFI